MSIPIPAAAAWGHSKRSTADAPRCSETSDDEHAVSSVRHGPVRPRVYDTRPDATERASEVPEYTELALEWLVPLLEKTPLAPRKKPIGAFASDSRQFDAQIVEALVSRVNSIPRFMATPSIFEIPNATRSGAKFMNDPYLAGT